MKKLILLFFSFLSYNFSIAQHEADNWRFGLLAGIDFSSGIPMAVPGSLNTNEGCTSISDGSGNLLFYTDGITVWDHFSQVMPNGSGLLGGISSTQSALIVPKPGNTNQYYIFTVDEIGGPNGFRYSIVDMTLQGGLGDVTSMKNILILNNVTEKLTAVKDVNGYWISVHEWGTNAFYTYKLLSTGLTGPVISNTGIVHNTSQIQNTYGQMKFSPCGNKIALATGYQDTVQVFDFSVASGLISTPITIPCTDHVYGLEFSANGSMLYITTYDPAATLLQYDLSSGLQSSIIATQSIISTTQDLYGLQTGPDKKIYVARAWNQFLGVINDPSMPGTSCNYIDNGFDLDPNFTGVASSLGLPGFIQSYFIIESACIPTSTSENFNDTEIKVYPNPFYDCFSIQLLNHQSTKIIIYDVTGNIIDIISTVKDQITYGEKLKPGIYIITVENLTAKRVFKTIKIKN